MTAIADTIRVELYGTPVDDIAPEAGSPELEDCGAGLSGDALLWWPQLAQD